MDPKTRGVLIDRSWSYSRSERGFGGIRSPIGFCLCVQQDIDRRGITLRTQLCVLLNIANSVKISHCENTGSSNTAIGNNALQNNTIGSVNTASGAGALTNNTTGSFNTATGVSALQTNTTGGQQHRLGRECPFCQHYRVYKHGHGLGGARS